MEQQEFEAAARAFWSLTQSNFGEFEHLPKAERNYETVLRTGEGRKFIGLAWPERRTCVSFEVMNDDAAAYERAGWSVLKVSRQDLEFLNRFAEFRRAHEVQSSREAMTTNVSKEEDVMLAALLAQGAGDRIPLPRRDYNWKGLDAEGAVFAETRPDFAWLDEQVALFVDGIYHHGGREAEYKVKAELGDEDARAKYLKLTKDGQKLKIDEDLRKRAAMEDAGWRTYVITDSMVKDPSEVEAMAKRVVTAVTERSKAVTVNPLED